MKNFYRMLIFEISFFLSILIFLCFSDYNKFDKNTTLSLLISIISIIVAIIITFLFSKLFSEKAIKVERKKEIDFLSIKITYLRRIAFHIRGMHEFWKIGSSNAKSVIDYKYKNLSYEEYRGYNEFRNQDYEEWKKVDQDISGTIGQAYLALKGLEDKQNGFAFFAEFNPQNYSLEDISRYDEYVSSLWSFFDRSDPKRVHFNKVNRYEMRFIDELFFKITGRNINNGDYRKEVKDLLSSFQSEIFQKHYFLTKLNSDVFPETFKNSFINLLIFILLFSLFIYIVNMNQVWSYLLSIILLSLFIANAIDLLIITRQSIISELKVEDIYQI